MNRLLSLLSLLALLLAGCVPPRGAEHAELAVARSHAEWRALLRDIRELEQRIGFTPTRNFASYAASGESFAFCGSVSRFHLPYSYEDPAIEWIATDSEGACRANAESTDTAFSVSEALGERETPVTASMLVSPLARVVYVVIHEDCHDQFTLPYGIEEALCNVITYAAMAQYAREKFNPVAPEFRAINGYAHEQSQHSRRAPAFYDELAALYAQHAGGKISSRDVLRERETIFRRAEHVLRWPKGSMNNIWIANTMTYARHHEAVERILRSLGEDVSRTVSFFRSADAAKPSRDSVREGQGLRTEATAEFIRAYEAAVLGSINAAFEAAGAPLAESRR